MCIFVYLTGLIIPLNGIYIIAIKMVVGLIIYISTLTFFKDEFLKNIFSKLNEKRISFINKIKKVS